MTQCKLSPSSIALFLDCPRCFWLHKIKGIKRPSGAFPSLPAGMDKILKEHFDKHREKGTVPEELDGKKYGVKLYPDKEKLSEWTNNRKGLRFTDEKSGIELMGALDNLLVTHEGKYAPLDYKTRGYPLKEDTHEHYQHQMNIYSFLLEMNGMQSAGFAILLFYHPLRVTSSCNVEFHAEPVKVKTNTEIGEKLFRDTVECLINKEPKTGKDCEWCRMI